MTTNWSTNKLGDVAKIEGGGTPSTTNQLFWNGDVPWLTPKELSDFSDSEIFDTERKITKEGLNRSSTKIFPAGTVLFTSRAPIGYVVIAGIEMATNQGFKNFICDEKILSNKFLYYFLKFKTKYLQSLGRGATFTEISRSILSKVGILIPPIVTQKQIVERLDKIAEAQKLNDELIQKTDELFQSLLHKELNLAGKNWKVKKLVEVADFLDNLRRPITASDRVPGPYPYYGANGQQDSVGDYIFDDELVLLAEDGGYFGSKNRPVAYRVSGKCWVNNHAHVLKNKAEISGIDFLGYSLMYYDVTPYITGSTRAKLNKSAAEKIKIPIPSLEIQKQIVAKLSAVQECKTQLLTQKSKLKELFNSALNKSMNGEPDD